MNLTAKKRAKDTKAQINQIRREGNIPAVFYAPQSPAVSIEVEGAQFEAALRHIPKGRLATTVFTLKVDGKTTKAIVKDIQYDVTTYNVIHLDFEELKEGVPVRINVPIECTGMEECVGIKQGGALRQIIRSVRVECLPGDIPREFFIDIRELSMRQSKKLSALEMPKGVRALAKADEVVAVIAKR